MRRLPGPRGCWAVNTGLFTACLVVLLLCGWHSRSPTVPVELGQTTRLLRGGGSGSLLTSLIPFFGRATANKNEDSKYIGPPAQAAGADEGDYSATATGARQAPLVRSLLRRKFQFHPRRPSPRLGATRHASDARGGGVGGTVVEYERVVPRERTGPAGLNSFFDSLDARDRAEDAAVSGARRSRASRGGGLPGAGRRVGPASLNAYFDSLGKRGRHAAQGKMPSSLEAYFDTLGPAASLGDGASLMDASHSANGAAAGKMPSSLEAYFDTLGPAASLGDGASLMDASHSGKRPGAHGGAASLNSFFDALGPSADLHGATAVLAHGSQAPQQRQKTTNSARSSQQAGLVTLSGAKARQTLNRCSSAII